MSERADDLHAAPPDAAGHQGVHGTPDQDLSRDATKISGTTSKDPSTGRGRGSWLPILVWALVVLGVALFWLYAHRA